MTVVGAVSVVGMMGAAQWVVSQTQFANVDKIAAANHTELISRIDRLERDQADLTRNLAHDPVESRTFKAVSEAQDKRIDLIQSQIAEIGRQIAAIVDKKP